MGFLKFLISQNIDNLHIKSGIEHKLIAELHGNYTLLKCVDCDARYYKTELNWDNDVYGWGARSSEPHEDQPNCPECNGRLISSIVNFKEPMPEKEMQLAKEHAKKCDLMIVIGSSLKVSPANLIPRIAYENGSDIVIINLDPTGMDNLFDSRRIKAKAGEILPIVIHELKKKTLKIPKISNNE